LRLAAPPPLDRDASGAAGLRRITVKRRTAHHGRPWTPVAHPRAPWGAQFGLSGVLARRNPLLLFRLSVVFLLRFAERTLRGSLFQEPPRFTR
jgi:hypothetical protein